MAALSLAGCSDDENGNGGNGGNGGSGEGGNPSGGDLTEILIEDGTQIGDGRNSRSRATTRFPKVPTC